MKATNSYSTEQQFTMEGTDGTVAKERYTGISNGPVLGSTRKKDEVRTTKRGNSKT
jgi:hypothetical protein